MILIVSNRWQILSWLLLSMIQAFSRQSSFTSSLVTMVQAILLELHVNPISCLRAGRLPLEIVVPNTESIIHPSCKPAMKKGRGSHGIHWVSFTWKLGRHYRVFNGPHTEKENDGFLKTKLQFHTQCGWFAPPNPHARTSIGQRRRICQHSFVYVELDVKATIMRDVASDTDNIADDFKNVINMGGTLWFEQYIYLFIWKLIILALL